MANKCGECQFFEGVGKKCSNGLTPASSSPACGSSFKGPASLFSGKKCGGCRLFEGVGKKCAHGLTPASSSPACNSSYAPIPG